MKLDLPGVGVFNATPFTAAGEVNEKVFVDHVRWLAEQGVAYVVPAAATGEVVSLTEEERRRLVRLAVEASEGRLRVLAYAGRPSTRDTIAAIEEARRDGAAGAHVMQPWFSKPDQRGLLQHFREVAHAASDFPLILYNNAERAGVSIGHDVMERLLDEFEQIVGIKDADLASLAVTAARFAHRVPIWARTETEMLPALALGSPGVVSVMGNYHPSGLSTILHHWQRSDVTAARNEFRRLYPLMTIAYRQPAPALVKFMMGRLGFDFGPCRGPIADAYPEHREAAAGVLRDFGLAA